MSDGLIEGKKLLIRDVVYICVMLVGWIASYMTTATTANQALDLARENKAYGLAREKMIIENSKDNREYARDYAYRKDAEIIKDVKKNNDSIHVIREDMVEAKVERSHLEKNQERMLSILEDLNRSK
tara:strand:- start:1009 stop:1389 length:381 start_codon:yes stop_codon:yes gene_type:complete